jgi:nitroimidazol reductase NimA-like FMN-containing flavoprotein (pyridoxamine 5'-phosphate oxidase superfamily)
MSPQDAPQRRFTSLPATECLALVRSHTIGRVGWNASDGPQILPVTYVLREGVIVFRTAPYGALAELRHAHQVAFEVDDFDVVSRTGWTVLVRGTIQASGNPDELAGVRTHEELIPWAPGARNLVLVITPEHVTGRQIS